MRVYTGFKSFTVTTTRKSLIHYVCHECGKAVLQEYPIQAASSEIFHVIQKNAKIDNKKEKASADAASALDSYDSYLVNKINVEKDYTCIQKKIVCPHCNKKMIWSRFPVPWTKSVFFILWIVLLAFLLLLSAVGIMQTPQFLAPVFILPVAALIPVFRILYSKIKVKKLKEKDSIPPVYYGKANIEELFDNVPPELLNNITKEKKKK